jgi:hypothetical protein
MTAPGLLSSVFCLQIFHLGMVYFFQPAQRRPISRGSDELNSRHHRHAEREGGEAQ